MSQQLTSALARTEASPPAACHPGPPGPLKHPQPQVSRVKLLMWHMGAYGGRKLTALRPAAAAPAAGLQAARTAGPHLPGPPPHGTACAVVPPPAPAGRASHSPPPACLGSSRIKPFSGYSGARVAYSRRRIPALHAGCGLGSGCTAHAGNARGRLSCARGQCMGSAGAWRRSAVCSRGGWRRSLESAGVAPLHVPIHICRPRPGLAGTLLLQAA